MLYIGHQFQVSTYALSTLLSTQRHCPFKTILREGLQRIDVSQGQWQQQIIKEATYTIRPSANPSLWYYISGNPSPCQNTLPLQNAC